MNRYNYDNKIGMYADDNGEWCQVDEIPKHETVEQWERRAGKRYDLSDIVWFYGYKRGEVGREWVKAEYWKVKDNFNVIVYNPNDEPPNK